MQIDNTKCAIDIPDPSSISDITFFLFPGCAVIPPGYGAILYFSTAPSFQLWELLGSISYDKPSATFRTGTVPVSIVLLYPYSVIINSTR